MAQFFSDVTLLVTHYNRSRSLENLLRTVQLLDCRFGEIIVSDDGSQATHIGQMVALQKEIPFRLLTTPQNKGLGNNINKGQDAVRTPYTLYIQEDFEPTPAFVPQLKRALEFLQKDPELDLVRFYAYLLYPYLKPYAEGFSEMQFLNWGTNYKKIYVYSDHPHLRRSTFLQKFGRYVESRNVDKTEYRMCVSFIKNRGKALFFNDYQRLLHQKNSSAEPSSFQRRGWTQSDHPLITMLRNVYRQVKYNYDAHFMRL